MYTICKVSYGNVYTGIYMNVPQYYVYVHVLGTQLLSVTLWSLGFKLHIYRAFSDTLLNAT